MTGPRDPFGPDDPFEPDDPREPGDPFEPDDPREPHGPFGADPRDEGPFESRDPRDEGPFGTPGPLSWPSEDTGTWGDPPGTDRPESQEGPYGEAYGQARDDARDGAYHEAGDGAYDEARDEDHDEARDENRDVVPDVAAAAAGGEVVEAEPSTPALEIWDTRRYGDRRRPTTAEQAVPWLIGMVLALAGIVIVLLALIYTEANGGFAASTSPSIGVRPSASLVASLPVLATPSESVPASATVTPAPTPVPTYGAMEMLYLARPTALGASELYRDDFATSKAPTVVAKSSLDIGHYAVAPDGTVMVAIVSGKLLAITPGKPDRVLASGVDAVTFGSDASTIYVAKVTRGGANDDATVYAISFASGTTTTLSTINFPHPASEQRSQLNAARFFDEGGTDRLFGTSDGNVVLWIANAGQWRIDPVIGDTIAVARPPVLWSPDGTRRISVTESGAISTLAVVDATGATISRVQVTGLLSHLRWSPKGDHVVFTLGINASGGGVRQDLYVWDLANGRKPTQLTANGATFGAEWLGVAQFWQP